MKQQTQMVLAACLLLSSAPLLAQEQDEPKRVEPERVIKQDAGQEVEEIRIQGRLDSVRVKPIYGPEYFFQDHGGDGTLSAGSGAEMDQDFNMRTWKLGEW